MRYKVLLRAVALLILAALLGGLVCLPVEAGDGADSGARLLCRASEAEDGILEIEISLESEFGICAMLCELDYTPDSLIYLSGGATDESVSYTEIDFGGELRFLIDSRSNTAPDGVLARLYFKRTGRGRECLSLDCRAARYLGDAGEILTLEVDGVPDISINADESGEEDDGYLPEITVRGIDVGRVRFKVKAEDCFAAGVRLFFADLSGEGEHFEVLVAGVVASNGVFRGEYCFSPDKRYALTLTAVGYGGRDVVRGEGTTVILAPTN